MTAFGPAISGEIPRAAPAVPRVDWADIAKGWCIILVVMMHSAVGAGLAVGQTGWLHAVVAFAQPFRMPDFFLVTGLFAGRAIALPWRDFLDRKIVHFAYFYALWFAIVLAAKSAELGITDSMGFLRAYLWGFVDPFSTMWFLQILPLFYLAARLLRRVNPVVGFAAATALHLAAAVVPVGGPFAMASNLTGWITFDNFALFFVFFLTGIAARPLIFRLALVASDRPLWAASCLAVWAIVEALAVRFGIAATPGLTLVFGLAGACAVVTLSSLLVTSGLFGWLGFCGRHTLGIYLAFTLPMGAARIALLKTGMVSNVGWMSVIITFAAVAVPLALQHWTRGTWLAFLFKRPRWARLHRPCNSSSQFQEFTVSKCD